MPERGCEFVIETDRLSKRFGRKLALRELTLRVPRGGIHALVGSNGAGKSTLFRVLLGLLPADGGTSRVLGVDSRRLDPATRGRVGLVHEEHTLPGWMSAGELRRMQRGLYPRWDETCFDEVIGHFQVDARQRVGQLSRGERAGLNLALALAQSPELLILDEPTLGLDVVARQAFLESLLFLGAQEGRTIVYCSHQMDEVERVADDLIVLERGELASLTSPEELCRRITCWVADALPPVLAPGEVPGLLQSRTIDGQQHLVVLDSDEALAARLTALGGRHVERLPLSFDRAINAYLTRDHAAPVAIADPVATTPSAGGAR